MGEIDFSKKIIKILNANILQMIIKKAVTKGFTVQGFAKNVWLAPETLICAALERKRKGKYQSSIFLEALSEIEVDDEVIHLGKKWLQDKDARDEIEEKIQRIEQEKTEKKRKEIIVEENNVHENIKKQKENNYEKDIQQLQIKNKKLQNVVQAYVPAIHGKEKRKEQPGKEGLLGVEGVDDAIVLQALRDALGAEAGAAAARPEGRQITYTDLYEWGLSGRPGSAERKAKLLNALGLPPRLSKKELVEALNRLYTFEQLDELQLKILDS